MVILRKQTLFATTLLLAAFNAQWARATTSPADPCSLLPVATLSSTVQATYVAPTSTVAPRPYANTVAGTDCHYAPKGSGSSLLFRIYFDSSSSDATGLFAKLKFFYSPATPVAGVGDEAYFDPRKAIHVLKGNVRFYLELGNADSPAAQQQITTLATTIAGQL
jgi:hypothetical protein